MTELTSKEFDLLLAAFHRSPDAISAFRRWNEEIDWDGVIDPDVVSLLPTVCNNLRSLGFDHPLFARFLGVDRKTWVENQRVKGQLMEWIPQQCFADMVVLPSTSYLFDNSVRIPQYQQLLKFASKPEYASSIVQSLIKRDWVPEYQTKVPTRWIDGYVWGADHLSLRRETGERLSLTWRLEAWFGARWRDVWERSELGSFGNCSVRCLEKTDTMEFTLRQLPTNRPFRWLMQSLWLAKDEVHWIDLRSRFLEYPLSLDALSLLPVFEEIAQIDVLSESDLLTLRRSIQDRKPNPVHPLHWFRGAWARYRSSWPSGSSWLEVTKQTPGYVLGRWSRWKQSRRRRSSDQRS